MGAAYPWKFYGRLYPSLVIGNRAAIFVRGPFIACKRNSPAVCGIDLIDLYIDTTVGDGHCF